jgi:hypothetical protein
LALAALPLTWYFAGLAFAFGFFNSTVTLVILLVAWCLWLAQDEAPPLLVAGLLSLTTVALLATWAPVAVIPAGLTILVLFRALRLILAAPSVRGWLLWVLVALPVPLYGLLVTLQDFGEQGDALAVEGGIPPMRTSHLFLVAGFATLVVLARCWQVRQWRLLGGLVTVLAASVALLAVLVFLNTRVGMPGWGYYPIKAAWAVTSLLLLVGLSTLFAVLLDLKIYGVLQALGGMVGLVLVGVLMLQYSYQPVGVRNFLAPIEVLRSSGPASGPWRANILFDSYRRDHLTILALEDARWMVPDQVVPGDGRADRTANFWLLQVHPGAGLPGSEVNDMRIHAYTLDPRSVPGICATMRDWNQPVEVLTVDWHLEQELRDYCPDLTFTVKVEQPSWPRGVR